MSTEADLLAAEEAAKQTAALFNQQNPVGDTEEEAAARAAAAEVNNLQGNLDHNGQPAVRDDTPEELAARATKAEEEAAAAKKAEEEAAEAAKTPEQKAEEAKAAEEAKEAERAEAAENTDGEWMTSESPEFNAAINMMKAGGMTPAEAALAFDAALQSGDMSKVDMDLLVSKVGADQASLIVSGFTRYAEAEGQAILERTRAVQDVVGGADNWSQMVKWARGKAKGDEAFKGKVEALTDMMNGDAVLQAELAAKEFLNIYNADSGNSSIAPKASSKAVDVVGAPTTPTAPTVAPMTAREYAEGVESAQRTMRAGALAAEMQRLSRGRAAGRSQGL